MWGSYNRQMSEVAEQKLEDSTRQSGNKCIQRKSKKASPESSNDPGGCCDGANRRVCVNLHWFILTCLNSAILA